ncbi:MAG TPA: secretin N-terminal domain-containing protein [Chthoniobacterales bacterium]|nr:secretin N-terminal domain-containing protein [Chthoniobacterales bacterium]
MVTLQYPNSDVVDVLRLYENLTGKKLIMDNFVQGKVNIFIAKPIPREEAIKIIEINLLLNKYSLVPAGGDLVKVIGTGQNPRTAGVPIISDEDQIPSGDHVISFLFKLRFADPTELQQVLGQYLSPPQAYTSFLALPKSSSILVTENSSVIRSLVNIINQVDIPPAEVVSEFIKLERADASKVVDMLKEVFDKGNQPPGTPGAGGAGVGVRNVRPGMPMPPPAQAQFDAGDNSAFTALSEDSVVVGKIKMAADVRTNRIHVITRPVNMPFVKRLISEFDANVDFAKPVTRPLRYISAADVLPVIVQALTEPGDDSAGGGANGATNPNPNQQQQQQNRNQSNSASTSSDFGNGGGGGQSFSEELSTQAVDTTPKAVTIGNAKIIADQRANTIIILGNREVVLKVMKILDEMDVSAPQVALSTVIGELTLNNNEEFGVDFFERFKRFEGPANSTGGIGAISQNNVNPTTSLDALRGFIPFAATAATGGANVFFNAGFGLTAIVRALDSTGRFKTISRPTVFTSNNKKAIIASGQEIPIPVSTISNATGGSLINTGLSQQSNIQFKKIAIQLEVVPLINSEREVSLDILQKVDSVSGNIPISGNSIPTIQTRYIKTTVTSPNGATIALGGLIQEDKNDNRQGIPILSKIPLLGGLFRQTGKTSNRRELIILMRPEVSLSEADLKRLRSKSEDKTHFGPEIDQDDCPDCPPVSDGKVLTQPDLPELSLEK